MHTYAINITNKLDAELYNRFLSFTDKNKKAKINNLKNIDDRVRTLLGDMLIRSIMCNKFNITNGDISYEYNIYGKPKLKGINNLYFNISHSGNWVVVAIDSYPIGIDIQKIISLNYIEISKRFFTQYEYKWLLTQKDQEKIRCFYKLWTVKESYVKMVGKGMSIPFNTFSVRLDPYNNIFLSSINNNKIEGSFSTSAFDKDYIIAVSSKIRGSIRNINIMKYDEILNYIRT